MGCGERQTLGPAKDGGQTRGGPSTATHWSHLLENEVAISQKRGLKSGTGLDSGGCTRTSRNCLNGHPYPTAICQVPCICSGAGPSWSSPFTPHHVSVFVATLGVSGLGGWWVRAKTGRTSPPGPSSRNWESPNPGFLLLGCLSWFVSRGQCSLKDKPCPQALASVTLLADPGQGGSH